MRGIETLSPRQWRRAFRRGANSVPNCMPYPSRAGGVQNRCPVHGNRLLRRGFKSLWGHRTIWCNPHLNFVGGATAGQVQCHVSGHHPRFSHGPESSGKHLVVFGRVVSVQQGYGGVAGHAVACACARWSPCTLAWGRGTDKI